jgi:hypothetical protein
MKLAEIMNYMSVTVITFLIGYLLSHAIIRTVDERLTDISINMPQIVLPKNIFQNNSRREFGPNDYRIKQSTGQSGGTSKKVECTKNIDPRSNFDTDLFKSEAKSTEKTRIAKILDTASHLSSTSSNNSKPIIDKISYYLDPMEMTTIQLSKFKQFSKPYKMTLIDYKRWLLLFVKDPHNLEKKHRDKLRIILKGGELKVDDLPLKPEKKPPQNAADWWDSNFNGNLPAPEFPGNKKGYNYDDFQYHENPKNLKHLTYMNPDELIKHSDRVLTEIRGHLTDTEN